MKCEIIAIGDELLIGQVTDTNSGWIARALMSYGWEIGEISVISDEIDAIIGAIDRSLKRVDCVLLTGGLGPTRDDVTKRALCEYFKCGLRRDKEVEANVERIFARRGLKMNQLTLDQALVPEKCRVIQNEVGTAPIMWFEVENKVVLSMPGVPHEMKTMMTNRLIGELCSHFAERDVIACKTLIVAGLSESAIAEKLSEFETELAGCAKLAYLPSDGLVRLRITVKGKNSEKAEEIIFDAFQKMQVILGEAVIACEDTPLPAILANELISKGLSISTAESCTGGRIASLITSVPGSSRYYKGSVVSYANSVKTSVLKVDPGTLQHFGAVSEPVVAMMAEGVSRLLETDCAIATSGVAGPDGGSAEKPVGTVWLAAKCGDCVETSLRHFVGSREQVIERASTEAQLLLLRLLRRR